MPGVDEYALYAGGASLLGGLAANNANSANNARNIRFQREMAQNARQYQQQDLISAGLNPILATGASGAKASGGSSIAATNPARDAVNSANNARLQSSQVGNVNAQTNTQKATTANLKTTGAILKENLKGAKLEGKIDETMGGELSRWLKRFGGVGGLFSSAKSSKQVFKGSFIPAKKQPPLPPMKLGTHKLKEKTYKRYKGK